MVRDGPADSKAVVRRFWQRRPCGSVHASAPEGSPEYFAQVERRRQELEPFITCFADFDHAGGLDVLEIGVGLGTDLVRFARAGARVTGVDLTDRAVALTRRRLALEGLDGDIEVADAEMLPFGAGRFDLVYSWGVLHHTTDPPAAIAEALRTVRPGGHFCVMLYARRSWVGIALWLRHALGRGRPDHSLRRVIAEHMESPGTHAYTERELRELFTSAATLRIDRVVTPYDRRVAGPMARALAPRFGWFAVVRGTMPS